MISHCFAAQLVFAYSATRFEDFVNNIVESFDLLADNP